MTWDSEIVSRLGVGQGSGGGAVNRAGGKARPVEPGFC